MMSLQVLEEELVKQFRNHADLGDGAMTLQLTEDQFCALLTLCSVLLCSFHSLPYLFILFISTYKYRVK